MSDIRQFVAHVLRHRDDGCFDGPYRSLAMVENCGRSVVTFLGPLTDIGGTKMSINEGQSIRAMPKGARKDRGLTLLIPHSFSGGAGSAGLGFGGKLLPRMRTPRSTALVGKRSDLIWPSK